MFNGKGVYMATTSYGTPMAMGSQPMTTTGLQAGVVRNMNLPLSRATPIQVTETTPNLEEIQGFPVAGRGLDGTHFHQDPITGQMYVMSDELHQRIPQILQNRMSEPVGVLTTTIETPSPTDTSDFLTLASSRFNEINENIGFSDLLGVTTVSDVMSFTQVVDDVQQSSFVPIRNQDYTMSTYKPADTVGGNIYTTTGFDFPPTTTIQIVNPINNSLPTDIINVGVESLQLSKPINKFVNSSGTLSDNLNTRYYIPINKFYNSIVTM